MRIRILSPLLAAGAVLSLTASDCVLETRQIEVPVRDSEGMVFTAVGSTEHSGEEVIDFTGDLLDLEDENAFESLLSAHIESGYWRVAENRGDADLVLTGAVTVTRLGAAAPGARAAAQTATLLSYQSVPIAEVTGDFQLAPLEEAGVQLLNAGFDEYLQARAAGQPVPDLRYRFQWSGTASSPSGTPDVDFDWEAKVKFTLVGLVEVDVPDAF